MSPFRCRALRGPLSVLSTVAGLAVPAIADAQEDEAPAIADNSFFIEEAYNQEPGVVQHTSTFAVTGASRRDLSYSLTQEWPLRGQRHQLSYTVPVSRPDGQTVGFGDILLNYRLQLGGGARPWAAAPRLSLVLPTGKVSRGLGDGSPGLQVNLPVSYRLTRDLVSHLNVGGTILPWARGPVVVGERPKRTLTSAFAGGSLIAPTRFPVQLMVESLVAFESRIAAGGSIDRATSWIISPGLRAALNLGGVQIVPGFAVPFTRSAGESVHDYFIYLSVEHGFSGSSGQ